MRRRQRGLATVEYAIGGAASLIVLIGCLEVGRMLFVWNTLVEVTRRAARLAAVCPMNDGEIARRALMIPGDGTASPFIGGLTVDHVVLSYATGSGAPAASVGAVRFVTASIAGYQHVFLVPFMNGTFPAPAARTTVPAESLGYVPELDARVCLGA